MIKVAVVCNCSTNNHNYYFTPSYLKNEGNYRHDLIIVHRNYEFIDKNKIINKEGQVFYINKILEDNHEIPNRGYGSYKYVFNTLKDKYDVFVFMQETCVIRRTNWIRDAINLLNYSVHIGFCASQIFNGNDLNNFSTKYPHETHMRAPGPIFIKTIYLEQIKWEFSSDHEGEMVTADLLVDQTGCIGVQIGNKLNFAYDTLGTPPLIGIENALYRSNYNHITQLLENIYFSDKNGIHNFNEYEFNFFEMLYQSLNDEERNSLNICSPFDHISVQNIFYDIQPFNNLIYGKSVQKSILLFSNNINKINNCFVLNTMATFNDIKLFIKNNCTSGLEIGGPTLLFTSKYPLELYDIFETIDNLNLYDLKDSFITIKNSIYNNIYKSTYANITEIDKKYDILISSHCVEHMANPIKIIRELKTFLKNDSYILTILPNKSEFWDNIRPTTTIQHLIQDFENNIQESDTTHEDENIVVNHPYKLNTNHPDKPTNISYEHMVKHNIDYRIMHHHCFDVDLTIKMHEYLNFTTLACFIHPDDKLQIIYLGKRVL